MYTNEQIREEALKHEGMVTEHNDFHLVTEEKRKFYFFIKECFDKAVDEMSEKYRGERFPVDFHGYKITTSDLLRSVELDVILSSESTGIGVYQVAGRISKHDATIENLGQCCYVAMKDWIKKLYRHSMLVYGFSNHIDDVMEDVLKAQDNQYEISKLIKILDKQLGVLKKAKEQ